MDKEYPVQGRNEIEEIDISNQNLESELDLSDFINLEKLNCSDNNLIDLNLNNCKNLKTLICYGNLLTSANFLVNLPNPEKLIYLDMGDNNFSAQTLSFLRPFTNLESLIL